jgi:hypothetical protein
MNTRLHGDAAAAASNFGMTNTTSVEKRWQPSTREMLQPKRVRRPQDKKKTAKDKTTRRKLWLLKKAASIAGPPKAAGFFVAHLRSGCPAYIPPPRCTCCITRAKFP